MGKRESMESSQSLLHNRRIQRSAGFSLFILMLIVVGFYGQRHWPEGTAISIDIPSGPRKTNAPVEGTPSSQIIDKPLYNVDVPEYDPENMPAIPSTTASAKKPIDSPVSILDPTRVALIIETRPLPILPAVLSQFINNLPPAWVVRLVGSQEVFSLVMLSASLARHIKSDKLVLTELPDYYHVNGSEAVSTTFTNLTFYSDFLKPAEWLFVFQADSMICSASEQSLDQWVDRGYSWVGAPWALNIKGGNGGFSLRHVPSIIEVLKNDSREANHGLWEDRWLCDRLPNIAPSQEAQTFSVESMWYERPLGYHLRGSGKLLDNTIWANNTRKSHILSYCPETKIILENINVEPTTEKENEKNDDSQAVSSPEAALTDMPTKTLDESATQSSETVASKTSGETGTETTESVGRPMETELYADTKA